MDEKQLQRIFKQEVVSITPLTGGDIASAQKVRTTTGDFFVKSASFPNALQLFNKEILGLEKLRQTGAINIPEVIGIHKTNKACSLILSFIENRTPKAIDMQTFGRALAKMHLESTEVKFGLETENFIGKLPQDNTPNSNWSEFYVLNRILPQLNMAQTNGHISPKQVPSTTKMVNTCEHIFGEVSPALLHGDLWSGNYLISTEGKPYLIDPAVYYGHNEVDLAMSKLFGGFSSDFYGAYHEILPAHQNQKKLVEIYQLYYLLVHLNLFGTSYRRPCLQILETYFL
ncbi:fructosamine kinase family protein [Croceivirga thetidis]|uniref:Fructosamine kinase family protein n=1 Tax=Croceivirga thetidis TaxID=2721623 RepID=A0ABX1GQE4_9FLAO|nr:fructosamine kinase family protein [Croceivirga thetidis]NKI32138.1 fructosamine kinase family protein [Croceivirga thetidis]